MNEPDVDWHDNRPADRQNPAFARRVVGAMLAMMALGVPALLLPDILYPRTFWIGVGITSVYIALIASMLIFVTIVVPSKMALEVRFGPAEMSWRTRKAETRVGAYADISMIIPSRWKGDWSAGVCSRHVVLFRRRVLGNPNFVQLTPANKDRLEFALAAWRRQQGIVP